MHQRDKIQLYPPVDQNKPCTNVSDSRNHQRAVRTTVLRPVEQKPQSQKVKVKSLSRVQLFAIQWTVAYQASPSMGFSRQECWGGLPFPSPGGLPDPGIKPMSPALASRFFTAEPPGKPCFLLTLWNFILVLNAWDLASLSRYSDLYGDHELNRPFSICPRGMLSIETLMFINLFCKH